jgi:hypothetical protein
MEDFVSVSLTNVASAINAGSAFTFKTMPSGHQVKQVCLDNQFNVDMVVMVNAANPVYLRSGASKILDLGSNQDEVRTIGTTLACYAAAGVAPTSSSGSLADNLIADCIF